MKTRRGTGCKTPARYHRTTRWSFRQDYEPSQTQRILHHAARGTGNGDQASAKKEHRCRQRLLLANAPTELPVQHQTAASNGCRYDHIDRLPRVVDWLLRFQTARRKTSARTGRRQPDSGIHRRRTRAALPLRDPPINANPNSNASVDSISTEMGRAVATRRW